LALGFLTLDKGSADMAKATKPSTQATGGQEAEPGVVEEQPKKSKKKKFLLIAAAIVLLAGGGTAAFLFLGTEPEQPRGGMARHETSGAKPTFVDLGQFTANLMREDEDRYLQVSISLKIVNPELEDRIKDSKPEILHRVNMLLQSKRPSELSTIEGKERLSQQILGQVEYAVGLRKTAPAISTEPDTTAIVAGGGRMGISDVLFTSFIIQ